ncbi:MAG TPA: J domain-containing protein [Halobacteriales archaeon]|nr:J domain-containing protein [Halobacteriales archaeon]
MLPEPIGALPGWLLAGVALGGLLALGFAAVFVVGVRAFPDPATGTAGPEGGERRRRAEVRRYLAAIDEPYLEDHVVAGRPTAFYLPERDVAITFDARDYFRFSGAGIRAVLLEYELPGAGLGSRLPFETPEPEPGTGSEPGNGATSGRASTWRRRVRDAEAPGRTADSAFATLGLPSGASESAVREAYRERVKDVHPDHGGDVESFRRLREAYTVARERAE